jgi:hypothetical protein
MKIFFFYLLLLFFQESYDICYHGFIKPGEISKSDLSKATELLPYLYKNGEVDSKLNAISYTVIVSRNNEIKEFKANSNAMPTEFKKYIPQLRKNDIIQIESILIRTPNNEIRYLPNISLLVSEKTFSVKCPCLH